ncbi:hypothetical protein [Gemmata sp.]|uniref:hypothetical protein n=1 Tax=Gemmata sp. TaxID=1914242 RepID=UPI003F6F0A52
MSTATATLDEPLLAPEPALALGRLRRARRAVAAASEWLFGIAALFLGLAVLGSVPVGQFLVLGYALEVCGRVARSGRLRDGFIGVRTFARLGGVAAACVLLWLPLYGVSIFAENAAIIDPFGPAARQWRLALSVLAFLYTLHVAGALLRGARFRDFFRPLNSLWFVKRGLRGGLYADARDRLWAFVAALRVPYYFWLGLRGFVGAFLWLAVPLALLGQGHRHPALGLLGGALLAVVVLYLPFLQARFARDNRLRAYRELRPVRAEYRRAPLAFALALVVHLLAAVPLYLLKVEAIPRDLIFLEGVVFLAFILPGRFLGGWAYSRPARRDAPRHWTLRWAGRLLMLPAVGVYVLVVFASQHIGWQGISSLYQQHAFLLPVPFVNLNG